MMLPCWRLLHFGPLIALFIIFVCYTVSVIDSMIWFMPTDRTSGKLNVIVLTIWLILIMQNFLKAIFGGPGYVPTNWKPEVESDAKYLQFCQVCQGYKPPRAHHCRICKRCVLKMDHHCPWINNCCGHNNHTNFVLFVFFAPIGCFHAFVVFVGTVWNQLFHRHEYYATARQPVHFSLNAFFMTIFAGGLALGTVIAVGILFYHQVKILISNATGIEQWIIEKAEDRKRGDQKFIYPYDYGKFKNILQVINLKCTPVGDGYSWPVVEKCTQFTLTIEQIQQKIEKKDRLVPFDVIKPYSGYWIPCKHGLRTCLGVPCTDEPRIAIKPGERIIVSRGNKHWLYGNKVLSHELVKQGARERGWFPRNCALKLLPSDYEVEYSENGKQPIITEKSKNN